MLAQKNHSCGNLLPAQLSQDLKMSWTALKFLERLFQPLLSTDPSQLKSFSLQSSAAGADRALSAAKSQYHTQRRLQIWSWATSCPKRALLREAHQATSDSGQAWINSSPWQERQSWARKAHSREWAKSSWLQPWVGISPLFAI